MKNNKQLINENLRLSNIVMKRLNKRGLLKLNKVLRESVSPKEGKK